MFNIQMFNEYIQDFIDNLQNANTQDAIFRQLYLSFGNPLRIHILNIIAHHLGGHYLKHKILDEDGQLIDIGLLKRLIIKNIYYVKDQVTSGIMELLDDFNVLHIYTHNLCLVNLSLELSYVIIKVLDKSSNQYFTLGSDFMLRKDGLFRFQVTVNDQTNAVKSHLEVQKLLLNEYNIF